MDEGKKNKSAFIQCKCGFFVFLFTYRLFFEASYSSIAIILTVWTLVGFVPSTPVLGMQAE